MVKTANGTRPQLKYLRGSACPLDPSTKLSSTIEFYCDRKAGRVSSYPFFFRFSLKIYKFRSMSFSCRFQMEKCNSILKNERMIFFPYFPRISSLLISFLNILKGTPILEEILHDCHHVFRWPTNVICPTEKQQFKADSCEIYTPELNATTGLRTIFKDGIVNVSWLNWIIPLLTIFQRFMNRNVHRHSIHLNDIHATMAHPSNLAWMMVRQFVIRGEKSTRSEWSAHNRMG